MNDMPQVTPSQLLPTDSQTPGQGSPPPCLRIFKRPGFAECWLTLHAPIGMATSQAAQALFCDAAKVLAEHGIEPIQEKIYGLVSAKEAILHERMIAYQARRLDPGLPLTWVEGKPIDGTAFAGLQIWGVIPYRQDVAVSTIGRGTMRGRRLNGPDFELVYFPGLTGSDGNGKLLGGVTGEATQMYLNAEQVLQQAGLTFLDVGRTWIYMAQILNWYGEFNRVRTAFFRPRHVGDRAMGHAFPASTGIQGRSGDEACQMDVLAGRSTANQRLFVPLNRSSRQEQAMEYGSAFSRGMMLDIDGGQTAFISGTASIGPDGKTRFLDSVEGQILETLLSIAALLQSIGAGLQDITSATLFCKDAATLEVFQKLTHLLGIPQLPILPIVADVCRADLLLEIEAVVAVPQAVGRASVPGVPS